MMGQRGVWVRDENRQPAEDAESYAAQRVGCRPRRLRPGKGGPMIRLCLRMFILGSLSTSILFVPTTAHAVGCGDRLWNTQAEPGDTHHSGVRATNPGMWVANSDVSCYRVSSLGIVKTADQYVEIGWYESPDGEVPSCPHTGGTPYMLIFADNNGEPKCDQTPAILSGGYFDSFKVMDDNDGNNWTYFLNSASMGFFGAGFSIGDVLNNAERHTNTDSAYAEFDGLDWLGNAGNWNPWRNTQKTNNNTDPDYRVCIVQQDHTYSKLSC